MKPQWVLEGTGAALLLLLPHVAPLLLPGNISIYHHQLPLTHLIGGITLVLIALALLGTGLITLLSRLPPLPRRMAAAGLAGLVVWRFFTDGVVALSFQHTNLVTRSALLSQWDLAAWLDRHLLSHGRLIAAVVFLALAALAWFFTKAAGRLVRGVRMGLASLAFCCFWLFPRFFYLERVAPVSRPLAHLSTPAAIEKGERVVWVLFDELSYNLVFDHPPPGQSFPGFDGLRLRSVSFGNLEPIGLFTDRVVPSLLLGQSFDEIRSSLAGRLSWRNQERNPWVIYDPRATLPGLAQQEGWNPGVAGWYLPYCRTFAPVLAACSWRPGIQTMTDFEMLGASEDRSAAGNALLIGRALAGRVAGGPEVRQVPLRARNIEDYRSVMARAGELIRDNEIRFVFVHLLVPHPPGFYDRRTHQLCPSGNYLDNLTLADDTLTELQAQIDRTPDAERTTLIVSSDHSWRVPLWKAADDWTPEEERISEGRFDQRPVFLIHFPGQTSGENVAAPLPEILEHDLMAAVLRRQMRSVEDLDVFLASRRQAAAFGNVRSPDSPGRKDGG